MSKNCKGTAKRREEARETGSEAMNNRTVAVVHDYLTQRGGAERVVLAMLSALKSKDLHTAIYRPQATYPEFQKYMVHESWLGRIPWLRQDPRLALPLLPSAIRSLKVARAEVILSSTSGWAHGVETDGVPLVTYCHSPAKWLYQSDSYKAGLTPLATCGLRLLTPRLVRWDQRAAKGVTKYLVNSTEVAHRVKELYRVEASVLHPPITLTALGAQEGYPGIDPGYLLMVARSRAYKNVSLGADAARRAGIPLVVVGGDKRKPPEPGVRLLGRVSDSQLRWLYANASLLLALGEEDFGLTPLEANAFHTPVVALRQGGYLDTVDEGKSGLFADTPDVRGVAATIREAVASNWSVESLDAHAGSFSQTAFAQGLHRHLDEACRV